MTAMTGLDDRHQPAARGALARRLVSHLRTPSSIASSTTPTGWNWMVRPCANSRLPSRPSPTCGPPKKSSGMELHPPPSQPKETRNDRRALPSARPGGSTGTSRARRCVSREDTPRRARVPPIDYRDGLPPCLTNAQEADITTDIQRRSQHHAALVAIDRNSWSRSVRMHEGSNRSRVTHIAANSARDLFEAGLNEAAWY